MQIKWRLAPDGRGGWIGVIDVGIDPRAMSGGGVVRSIARGPDKATALAKAAALADNIVENPILAAILPPQAGLAVKAVKALSKSAMAGKLEDAVKGFTGPAVKRLGKVLGGIF